MTRPLNMSELDYLREEVKRLQDEHGEHVRVELDQLRERCRQLEYENGELKRRLMEHS